MFILIPKRDEEGPPPTHTGIDPFPTIDIAGTSIEGVIINPPRSRGIDVRHLFPRPW